MLTQKDQDAVRYEWGYKAGHADKLMGIKSDYAWFGFSSDGKAYCQGYRDGWNATEEWK